MRIKGEEREAIAAAVRALDTDERRRNYREGNFPNADKVKDINMRYRWDLLWAAGAWRLIPDDALDSHVDTVLRRAIPPLSEGKEV